MVDVKELIVRLSLENEQLKKNLKDTRNNLKQTEDKTNAVTKAFKLLGGAFLVTKIIQGFKKVVGAAIDAQETFSKFDTVFKDVRDEANKTAKNLADNFGLSSVKAKQLLSDTGDLLTGFGFTGRAALDLSDQVNKLAVDLASFTNYQGGAEGASQALTKALLGERESVKSLGIAILETDVQAKVLQMRQEGMTFASERQAKAYATLAIAQEQSKNAIGDFARTSGNAANQIRTLGSRFQDFIVNIGEFFLPTINDVLRLLNKLFSLLKSESDEAFDTTRAEAYNETIKKINESNKKNVVTIESLIKNQNKLNNAISSFVFQEEQLLEQGKKREAEELRRERAITQGRLDAIDEILEAKKEARRKEIEGEVLTDQQSKEITQLTKETLYMDEVEKLEFKKQKLNEYLDHYKLTEDQIIDIKRTKAEIEKKIDEETTKEKIKNIDDVVSKTKEAEQSMFQVVDIWHNRRLQIIQNRVAKGEISEKEGQKQIAEAERKKAIFDRVKALTDIAFNTATGIMKSIAASPLTGGLPWSSIVGVAGAAQVAGVLATPLPEIPKFQRGGIIGGNRHSSGGELIEAERGESILNREATAILGIDAIRALNEGRSMSNNINIVVNTNNSQEVVDVLNDYFRQFGTSSRGVSI